jgi:cysteine desulfuration protein SufE
MILAFAARFLLSGAAPPYIWCMPELPTFSDITETFDLLDDWEDRYRYVIDLGKSLPPLPESSRTPANKVQGCTSQVWLDTRVEDGRMRFAGDSDAHIVKGLVALLIALHSGRSPSDILATDTLATFKSLGLDAHLSPQRSNGLRSMVERMRADARRALEKAD